MALNYSDYEILKMEHKVNDDDLKQLPTWAIDMVSAHHCLSNRHIDNEEKLFIKLFYDPDVSGAGSDSIYKTEMVKLFLESLTEKYSIIPEDVLAKLQTLIGMENLSKILS